MSGKKNIRVAWRKDAGKFQICYGWSPGKWILTPCTDREAAIVWAKDNETIHKHTGSIGGYPAFGEIAQGFFDIGGPYYQKKEQKDKHYLKDFYRNKAGYLKNHIMPYFKHFKINEITTYIYEEFSLSLKGISMDTKNRIIIALKEIFNPLVSKGVLAANPVEGVERFRYIPCERMPFTGEELEKLYPADIRQALEVWGSPVRLAWGLVLRDTGCRPSEAIAWTWEDYSEKHGGVTIVKRLREGTIVPGTKSGVRHFRAAILSAMGIQAVLLLQKTSGGESTERVFPFSVSQGLIYFREALDRAGIPAMGRTQYCLRHTAITQTIDISREYAQKLFGHTAKVQEGYDHPDTDEMFQRLDGARDLLEKRLKNT